MVSDIDNFYKIMFQILLSTIYKKIKEWDYINLNIYYKNLKNLSIIN